METRNKLKTDARHGRMGIKKAERRMSNHKIEKNLEKLSGAFSGFQS